jgi:uncharacterized membrane-anchored protein YhcB (DUF1043 family)
MSMAVLIGIGVLILAIGIGVGFLFGHILRLRETAKVSDIEAELEKYRRDVTEHFNQTAIHFQALGQQYRDLYEHMGSGAEKLCDTSQLVGEVSFSRSAMLASASEAEAAANDEEPADEELEIEPVAEARSEGTEENADMPDVSAETDEALAAELPTEPEAAVEKPQPERTLH